MILGLTQPLTEMSTRNISWGGERGLRWPVRRADKLTTFICQLSWNLGASTSWNPQCLSRSVQGFLYLYLLPAATNVISLNFTYSTISLYSLLISSILCCSVLISFSLTSLLLSSLNFKRITLSSDYNIRIESCPSTKIFKSEGVGRWADTGAEWLRKERD